MLFRSELVCSTFSSVLLFSVRYGVFERSFFSSFFFFQLLCELYMTPCVQVQAMKLKWNKLRERNLPAEERVAIIEEILPQVRGKIQEVAAKHDSTRVIQCILQYGNKQQREIVLAEALPKLVEVRLLNTLISFEILLGGG